jgi:hypothetical protein
MRSVARGQQLLKSIVAGFIDTALESAVDLKQAAQLVRKITTTSDEHPDRGKGLAQYPEVWGSEKTLGLRA